MQRSKQRNDVTDAIDRDLLINEPDTQAQYSNDTDNEPQMCSITDT